MSTSYPKRPKFFSHRYVRLLAKAVVAQDLGPEVCWLLTVIVHTEDARHYSGPVTYFNEQLAPLCGFSSVGRLIRARSKAMDAGWLYYSPGGKGRAGRYWVRIPSEIEHIPDGPSDESDAISPSKMEGQAEGIRSASGRESVVQVENILPYPLPDPNSHSSCPGQVPDVATPPGNGSRKAGPKFSPDDSATATFIWDRIRAMQPDRKPPNLDKWATTVRLMREQDGRTHDQIRHLFKLVNRDPFWRTNILSPEKLRAKWDDLRLKLVNGNGKPAASKSVSKPMPPPRPSRNGAHHHATT